MKNFKGTKGIILLCIMALLIVGYYYHLSNRMTAQTEETPEGALTEVDKVLTRNLETNYPQTPREVVKYFSEITKCLYNEELTEDDVHDLGMKLREIYDDDLVANQTEEEYIKQLADDITTSHTKKQTFFNYTLSSSIDVQTYSMDGRDWAELHCIYGIRQNQMLYNSDTLFLLRKDGDGHYKIYGWQLVSGEE